jgi:hypothetical protein
MQFHYKYNSILGNKYDVYSHESRRRMRFHPIFQNFIHL